MENLARLTARVLIHKLLPKGYLNGSNGFADRVNAIFISKRSFFLQPEMMTFSNNLLLGKGVLLQRVFKPRL
jgi:hypothetical protein